MMVILIIIITWLLYLHLFTLLYINKIQFFRIYDTINVVNHMKKVNKRAKRRLFCLFTIFVLLITYVSYSTVTYWDEILSNKKEEKILKEKYANLLEDKEILEDDVVKLQDPEYVAKYAREKYLYSKDGELIIKIIDEN